MTHDEYLIERPALVNKFYTEAMENACTIDPGKCEDWRSLALGWGVANSLTPECAVAFANYMHWKINYG